MKLVPSTQYGNRWVATVYDQGVIDWFVAQSQTFHTTTVEYSGQTSTATVQRAFPWMVSVEGDQPDRRMIVRDLKAHPDRYITSGRGGVIIDAAGDGLRMKIDGMKLVSSHIAVYYDIGEWTFESCTAEVPAGSACDEDELADDPLCAM